MYFFIVISLEVVSYFPRRWEEKYLRVYFLDFVMNNVGYSACRGVTMVGAERKNF